MFILYIYIDVNNGAVRSKNAFQEMLYTTTTALICILSALKTRCATSALVHSCIFQPSYIIICLNICWFIYVYVKYTFV